MIDRETFDKFMTKVKSADDWQDTEVPVEFWSPSLRMRLYFAHAEDGGSFRPFSIVLNAGRTVLEDGTDRFEFHAAGSTYENIQEDFWGEFYDEFRDWAAALFSDRIASNFKSKDQKDRAAVLERQRFLESWIESP